MFNSIIKSSEKDKIGYNLLVKDSQMNTILKGKKKIDDVEKQLNSFAINRDLIKELKEVNDIFLKHYSNMKQFKKIYKKRNDEKNEIYEQLKEIILK